MAKHTVRNYPSPRLMETIGATNQSVPEAIGELVANCFDARITDSKVNIIVDLRDDEIKVIDDGKGMISEVLEKAVCIAEDMSKHIERGDGAKGHFGMGFKTSCSTLGRYYEIYTKPVEEEKEYHVEFDIAEYSKRPSNDNAWDVVIEDEISFVNSPIKNRKHGTAFVIKNLKKKVSNGAIYEYLGEAFKGHLETGDAIIIKSEGKDINVESKKYNFLPHTKIDINESFKLEEGDEEIECNIRGWVALDENTHNNGNYGFNIYRNNQLLEKWNKDWFNAHLMTSRIIGEVNMDFLESTFYKQGTQQSVKWIVASEHMKEYLKGIVKASREVSKEGNISKPNKLKKIVTELNNYYNTEVQDDIVIDNQLNENLMEKEKNSQGINNGIKGYFKEETLVLDDIGEIEITFLEKESELAVPFDYIYADGNYENKEKCNAELQVILIKNHPLWNKKVDIDVQKIIATSDSIYRMLIEKLKFDTSDALKIRNEWINQKTEK